MKWVEPKVAIIAETKIEHEGLHGYLDDIGAGEYDLDMEISDIENLTQVAGKACYKSFIPKLNPNVNKVRTDSASYLENINKVGHGSVLEHGWVSFVFWNVSRVFTHELVRHRVGTAMSQESLRYVRLTDLGFWMPQMLKDLDNSESEGQKLILDTVEHLEGVQKKLAEIYDIENMKDFSTKKKLTSAFRRVAPIGLGTAIVWSMNIRSARNIIQLRTSRHAEEEIRFVFDEVAEIMYERYTHLFSDFSREEVDGYGEWKSKYASAPFDGEKIKNYEKKIVELEEKNKELESKVAQLSSSSA